MAATAVTWESWCCRSFWRSAYLYSSLSTDIPVPTSLLHSGVLISSPGVEITEVKVHLDALNCKR